MRCRLGKRLPPKAVSLRSEPYHERGCSAKSIYILTIITSVVREVPPVRAAGLCSLVIGVLSGEYIPV